LPAKPHILTAPLDWGLGHATRCIPIIRFLLEKGCRVSIGGSGAGWQLLQQHFPQADAYELPAYAVRYPHRNMYLNMARQLPHFWRTARRERDWLARHHKRFDAVISDNRFGLFQSGLHCVYLTHQVQLPLPWLASPATAVHRRIIRRFHSCWIPDTAQSLLAGRLSRSGPLGATYVGPLSDLQVSPLRFPRFAFLCVLSGPEPMRSHLEDRLYEELQSTGQSCVLIRGSSRPGRQRDHPLIKVIDLVDRKQLGQYIAASDLYVGRSGYSTLMDLYRIRRPALLIPTPGQYEQEYLATYHAARGPFLVQRQDEVDLAFAQKELSHKDWPAELMVPFNRLEHNLMPWLRRLQQYY